MVEHKENNIETLLESGDAYKKLGNLHAALVQYQLAFSINSKSEETCLRMADVFLMQSRYPDAKQFFSKTLEINPENTQALLGLGEVFSKALEINPNNAEAHFGLAQVYLHKGNLDEAYAHAIESIKHDPRTHESRLILGRCSQANGDYEDAFKMYRQVVDHAHGDIMMKGRDATLNLARELYEEEEYEVALKGLDSITHLFTDDQEMDLLRAYIKLGQGDLEVAARRFQYALASGGDQELNKEAAGQLVSIHTKLGNTDLVQKYQTIAKTGIVPEEDYALKTEG